MAPVREIDEVNIPEVLPMLPVRDVVVFPYMVLPLFVGRESSIRALNEALAKDRLIFLASQKNIREDQPNPDSIYNVGTVAMIIRIRKMPDGRVRILAQGIARAQVKSYESTQPYYTVKVQAMTEAPREDKREQDAALMKSVKEQLEQVISLGKILSPDILLVVEEITDPGRLADIITTNLGLKVAEAQDLLSAIDPAERLVKVRELLRRELEQLAAQAKVRTQNQQDQNSKAQRDNFLREQMKNLRGEQNESDPKTEEMNEIREKIERAPLNDEARIEANKQLNRLERMHPDSSEATIVRTYIDWLCDLPWARSSDDALDLANAKEILDEDHFDLEKVKERILEFLAVRKLRTVPKGPILCLSGPPGVGKTSLGKSIARSMGRKFVRISLGGVHDEAEVRGHRRTYVGAMPGKILQAMKQSGTNNPVILLDEIDKLGRDYKGDPSSALLEVLDPEQNSNFKDHYVNIPFDLSKVFFIATANVLEAIPAPLRDRMEVIQIPGYTQEDKVKIAKKYIVPKQIEENGIPSTAITFSDAVLSKIVSEYTREAGLRNLERLIATCSRKVARDYATWEGTGTFPTVEMTAKTVEKFLGAPKYLPADRKEEHEVGCVTGLAWTAMGGEVLEVEATAMKGRGAIRCTGSLGDVMKESCEAAVSWIRANAKDMGIEDAFFSKHDIHIHFPSGAVPKDGPSAGITITTALVSLATGIPVRKDVAMTGEISLLGKVLPIGGLKEKSLAALRHGIKSVVMPFKNEKDLEEIPEEYKKQIEFRPVKAAREVLEFALLTNPFKVATRKIAPSSKVGAKGRRFEEAA